MGNNMGRRCSKSAKIMKINGEFFKMKLPSRVFDAIKDHPNHVLLDSDEFIRFRLRAKPLNPETELKPRKVYLLVELPKFPNDDRTQGPLRKVKSGVLTSTTNKDLMMNKVMAKYRRSISDDHMIDNRSRSGPLEYGHVVGPTRVKMRLPKAQVQRIMEENGDDNVEVAKKIYHLCLDQNAAV